MEGVSAAVVVGRDGFVIESAVSGKVDIEALGAMASTGLGTSEAMGSTLGKGELLQMLVELGEYREARIWADKALERFPNEPDLLAAKAVALGRGGDLQAALAFSDAPIEERGDTPYVWLARGAVLLAAKQKQAVSCIEQAVIRARQLQLNDEQILNVVQSVIKEHSP